MNETKFLVAGATGMSGNHVARLLVKRRHAVRVRAHRKDDRSRALENLGAGVVYGDLRNLTNVVGRVLDRPIRYEEITCEALAESIGQGHNTYFKEHRKAIVVDLRKGVFASRNDVLQELTCQGPTTLPEFGNRHRQAFT